MAKEVEDRRVARVFVSSTFQDMHRERDILTRAVFPRLRDRFGARDISLFEVDLRWGITQELAETRGTVNLCLEEIEACRPLFFCMLGERYGWCPPSDAPGDDPGWSVTELEIRRALKLISGTQDPRLVFFMRAGVLSRDIEARPDNEMAMAALKQFVRAEPRTVIHEYSDFNAFETEAERALAAAIEQWSSRPVNAGVSPNWRGVPRPQETGAIERATVARRPAIITGPSGSGTSWLGEEWARTGLDSRSMGIVINGRQTKGLGGLAGAIRAARIRRGFLQSSAPVEGVSMDDEILALAADAKRLALRVRLFVDHLEEANVAESQTDLSAFPLKLPPSFRVLIGTRSGRCIVEARERRFDIVDVEAITPQMARSFAGSYLQQFGKHLTARQSEELASSPLGGNVGALVLCLEELRRFSRMELLEERLHEIVSLSCEDSVITTMLEGLRMSVPEGFRDAVDRILIALSLSVRGLEEAELCAIAGSGSGQHLPPYVWATIRSGLGRFVISRGARVDLADGAIRRAACQLRSGHPEKTRQTGMALLDHLKIASQMRWTEEAPNTIFLLDGPRGLGQHLQAVENFLPLMRLFPGYAVGLFELLGDSRVPLLETWTRALARASVNYDELWQLGLLAARSGALSQARLFWMLARESGDTSETHAVLEALMLRDIVTAERLAVWQPPPKHRWLSLKRSIDRAEASDRWMRAASMLALSAEGLIRLDAGREFAWIEEARYCIGQLAEDAVAAHGWTLIGQVQIGRARWRAAADAFERAVQSARRCGHARRLCVALERSAVVSIELHIFSKARELAAESLLLSRECGIFDQESLAFECLIEVERRRANWEEAFRVCGHYIQRAHAIGRNLERAKKCLHSLDP